MARLCNDCPRKCNAMRTADGNIGGFCRSGDSVKMARAALHFGEEPCISHSGGSGTIFFSGCTLRCVYCQNDVISHRQFGKTVSVQRIADIMRELEEQGADNINFVSGSHYIHAIREALHRYHPSIPTVWNSGGYDCSEMIAENLFDIYLMDLKYLSSERAARYSFCPDYPQAATRAVLAAYRNCQQPIYDSNGRMLKGLIVRHLVLPFGTAEAIRVIQWFAQNTPKAVFSLMAQYTPCTNLTSFPEINRKITKREYRKVTDALLSSGIENAYVQDLSSGKKSYIPNFDLTGV